MRARIGLTRSRTMVMAGILALVAVPAWAQEKREVELTPVEVAIGPTINALLQDVNTAPDCVALSLPCTHEKPSRFAGFGLNLAVAGNLSERFAIAADLSLFEQRWDSSDATHGRVPVASTVKSLFVGPRFSTKFYYPGNRDPSPGRFFGQVLVGTEGSSDVPSRPALLLGAGADVLIPRGGSSSAGARPRIGLAVRMALDYLLAPGAGRNVSGWRFVFGLVLGPHFR
jgi:hypothetical protein